MMPPLIATVVAIQKNTLIEVFLIFRALFYMPQSIRVILRRDLNPKSLS